jgi:lipopolysaccharide export system permease protein
MRTLHRYLLRQILATLGMTVLVFAFILMLGESLKEILGLLVSGQVGLGVVAQVFLLLIPYVLVFALPMGLLTATLLVYGRLSADQELTAARACGISLVSLAFPALLLAVLCTGLSLYINLRVAPECRSAYRRLLFQVGTSRAADLIPAKTFIRDFTGYILYAGEVDGLQLQEVIAYQLDESGRKKNYLRADRGVIELDTTNRTATLSLMQGWQFLTDTGLEPSWHSFGELQLPSFQLPTQLVEKTKINNMSFDQLMKELREMDARMLTSASVGKLSSEELRQKLRDTTALSEVLTEPIRVQLHRQVSFSFACVGFTLVGIPLAIRAHRRETSVGFAIALILVLIYYGFFILAQSLETRPELFPHLILWLPNFLFQSVGGWMLWKANRTG